MWSPERLCRNVLIGLAFFLPALALAGCTLTPVYSDAAVQQKLLFHYAEPTSRLEQIVYQDLALRFGGDAGEGAPRLRVAVRQSARRLTLSAKTGPVTQYEAIVRGTVTVVSADGTTLLLSVSRTASAGFETASQVFANREAAAEAAERATHELAESLRLALLAGLAAR